MSKTALTPYRPLLLSFTEVSYGFSHRNCQEWPSPAPAGRVPGHLRGSSYVRAARADNRTRDEREPGGAVKVCELCGGRYKDDGAERCPLDGSPLVPLRDPLIGRTVGGRYVILERIGAGGMGTIYRARHEVVGRDVAVKFLARQLAIEPSHRARFLREARAANRINHEHIIDITDCGEMPDGLVYLVMEFLDGAPLSAELARVGAMPVRRALLVALQIARALARAHELDVVHRDIKPDNIFLLNGYDGDFVKILDFGLAQMRGELRLTATGTVFGTPEYMSPEQVRGAPVTYASDLYSLGVVLFEMLAGTALFEGSTPDLIMKHLRVPPRPPSQYQQGIPVEVDMLVLRLLAKEPKERPISAHQLAEEIKVRLATLGGAGPVTLRPHTPARATHEPKATQVTEVGSGTLVTAWRARVDFFFDLAVRAHGATQPAWLSTDLRNLRERVERMAEMREDLTRRIAEATEQEDQARNSRLRIGRALDELTKDETRVLEAIRAAEGELGKARAALAEATGALPSAWAAIPTAPPGARAVPEHVLARLLHAGELARRHADASAAIARLERDLDARARECEDLRFQMAQLKGRMGSFNAVTEIDLDDLRAKTMELDKAIEEEIEDVVQVSARIVQHFMQFPELRDMVRVAHASAGSL
jgi:serine/threonine-protein kinase